MTRHQQAYRRQRRRSRKVSKRSGVGVSRVGAGRLSRERVIRRSSSITVLAPVSVDMCFADSKE